MLHVEDHVSCRTEESVLSRWLCVTPSPGSGGSVDYPEVMGWRFTVEERERVTCTLFFQS
ncbi:hypothetical protein CCR75_001142 [Bremia lactucae]|uniref:Uncharacterized protein n=1 Tax=Bremia lactucae TaxID=4779 RepID=A0A976FQN2_BRELC|nr:hypothetical protein CCR75_001142 [Bremia lactucae]